MDSKIDLERGGSLDPEIWSDKSWYRSISVGLSRLHNDLVDIHDTVERLTRTMEKLISAK